LYFVSSRRRHTRCLSDWSSDVCSSDLLDEVLGVEADGERRAVIAHIHLLVRLAEVGIVAGHAQLALLDHVLDAPGLIRRHDGDRSEERRVGKECRWRWW